MVQSLVDYIEGPIQQLHSYLFLNQLTPL